MENKSISELLERYQNNECTPDEKKTVEQWFDNQSANGEWEWTNVEEHAIKVKIKRKIDEQLFSKKYNWAPLFRVAAMLMIILGVFLFFKSDLNHWINPVTSIEKTVKQGEHVMLTLADGTKVWLNGGSKFRYPSRFESGNRQVFLLEGEAYFDVSHDPAHPFIVECHQLSTKVLGTAFNIKAYSYLSAIQVAVSRGKVCVSDTKGKSITLLPGQQADLNKRSGVMEKQLIDAKTAFAWQNGGLAFNNARMLDVCVTLSKKYHINFKFNTNDIQDYQLTAGFEANDSLTSILAVLASANNLSFILKNHTVIFYKK